MQPVGVQPEPAEYPVAERHGEQGQGPQTVDGPVAVGGGGGVDTGSEPPYVVPYGVLPREVLPYGVHRAAPSGTSVPVAASRARVPSAPAVAAVSVSPRAMAAKARSESVPGAK